MDMCPHGHLDFRRVGKERDLLRLGLCVVLIAGDIMAGYHNFWRRCHGGLKYFIVRGGRIFLCLED